jgi:hypothetical protein
MMAGPAGIFEHFLAIKSIKKVPKERGTRSNAGLGASGYTCFLFYHSIVGDSDFVCHAVMSCSRSCHDVLYHGILSQEVKGREWLDVFLFDFG